MLQASSGQRAGMLLSPSCPGQPPQQMFLVLRSRRPDTAKAVSPKHPTEHRVPKRGQWIFLPLNAGFSFQILLTSPLALKPPPGAPTQCYCWRARTTEAGTPALTPQPHSGGAASVVGWVTLGECSRLSRFLLAHT